MIHIMININERQDQTFTSRSNIYVYDNKGRDLYLLGVKFVKWKTEPHTIA